MATKIEVWDKDCLGCRMSNTDVMVTVFTKENGMTDFCLTQEEAIDLKCKLDKVISINITIEDNRYRTDK